MQSGYAASLHLLLFPLLLQFILYVDRTASDNAFARIEATVDLQASVLLYPDLHFAPLEHQRFPFDPDDGGVTLPDHSFDRNRKGALTIADRDLEAGKHFGFEGTVG